MLGRSQETPENYPLVVVRGFFYRLVRPRNAMVQRQEAEKLIKIIRPYPVKYLYKYMSMESKGLEDVFFRKKIYLTDGTKFNDPF